MALYCYTTNMFAICSKQNKVLGWASSSEEAFSKIGNNDFILIEMTQDNSPAFLNGYWDGKKFTEPKEQ